MNAFSSSLLIALLTCSAAIAQRRQPLIGNVVDAEGKPFAGATVTLIEDDLDQVGLDPVDVVTTTSDERGRFVVSAQVGVLYTAVAVGPEVDGEALVAPPVQGQSCGRVCGLKMGPRGRRQRVPMPLAPELRAVPGLHVRMEFQGGLGHHVVLPIDDQGVEVPPIAIVANFTLRDGQGAFLGTAGIATPGLSEAYLPSPYQIAVRVIDEAGEPVEGARVAMVDPSWGTVGHEGPPAETDAKGNASLLWAGWHDPFEEPPETLFVVASKPGFAEGASGWVYKNPFVGFEVVTQHKSKTLVVPLTKRTPPRGVAGKAFAGRAARVQAMGLVTFQPNGHYYLPRQYDVVIAADGSYTVPDLAPSASTVRLHLSRLDGRRLVVATTHAPALPDVDVTLCDAIVAQVIDESGGPATGAKVLVSPPDASLVQPLVPDAAGKCEVTLPRGRWLLFAMDDTGWATHEFDGTPPEPITLRLAEKPQRRVRVLDREGRAVAGATFEPGEFRFWFPRPSGLDALLFDLGWNTFAEHLRRARTDEHGEATLYFLPWPRVTPTAFAFVGTYKQRSDDVAIEAGDDVLVVRLR